MPGTLVLVARTAGLQPRGAGVCLFCRRPGAAARKGVRGDAGESLWCPWTGGVIAAACLLKSYSGLQVL
jgi:hypothetical protein